MSGGYSLLIQGDHEECPFSVDTSIRTASQAKQRRDLPRRAENQDVTSVKHNSLRLTTSIW